MNTKFDIDRAAELYKSGISFSLIAKEIGSSVSVVRYHLMALGIHEVNKDKYEWPIEQMRKWYEDDGMTVEQIGNLLQRSSKVVNKVCKKNGFRMRPRGQKFGSEHKGWKGGRTIDKDGYVLVYAPDHPNSNRCGYIREHRLVMEKKIGRILLPNEVVHHIDDVKNNNHPDNLELFQTNGQHLAKTLAGKCPNWTPDGRVKIAEACRKGGILSASRKKKAQDALRSQ